jgi:WD40 repeat protein
VSLGVSSSQSPEFATLSADGKTVALGDRLSGTVTLYDLAAGRIINTLPHAAPSRVAVSADGAWLAGSTWWGTPEGIVRLWDIHGAVQIAEWTLANQAAVTFSPNGKWLWIGAPREGKLIRVGNWETIRERKYDGLGQGDAVFSPDSSLLAINASTGLVQLVDPLTGDELATLEAGRPLCFSHDGRLLITVADQQSVQVWDLALIRRELSSMSLDWSVNTRPEQMPQSAAP